MKIAIAGGALQGVEVAYLARKAGIETVLLDRRASVPAGQMADTFRQADVTDRQALARATGDVDLIFPALENPNALSHLHAYAQRCGLPMVHDPDAYAVSASKIKSERFFQTLGIPVPTAWPGASFPVIAKPSGGSGSRGVRLFTSPEEVHQAVGPDPAHRGWLVQSFLPGPTYSVEVLGGAGRALNLQVTDLHMDADFDCKRVSAPSSLPARLQAQLADLSRKMAASLQLTGIMDVEAVLHDGRLKVLEIDARFPSQTPITVYWSRGINMVDLLVKTALGAAPEDVMTTSRSEFGVIFEHIRVTPDTLEVTGEHALAAASGLQVRQDFFGADEAITDYAGDQGPWVATLICRGPDLERAWERRHAVVAEIRRRLKIQRYRDPSPAPVLEEG
jgi:pyrrolysine biosynthesis protein PylC